MLIRVDLMVGNGVDPCDVTFVPIPSEYSLDVKPYYTVGNVKAMLEKEHPHLDRNLTRLIHDGRFMEDVETLDLHSIKHNSTIQVYLITGERIDYRKPKWFQEPAMLMTQNGANRRAPTGIKLGAT